MRFRLALLAAAVVCATAASSQAVLPSTPAQPRFADLPDIAVTYYDVSGHDVREIHTSVAKQAPRDPVAGTPLPASSSWTVGIALKSLTTGKGCKVTAVTLRFQGKAVMPRLLIDKDVPASVVSTWNSYVARLEAGQAAQLRFAYDRMGEVERAIREGRCDQAQAATDAALARLQEEQRLAFRQDALKPPKLEEPKE